MYIPESESYDADGNVTHFGVIDPMTGQPALIPNIGGNYNQIRSQFAPLQLADHAGNAPSGGGSPPPPEEAPSGPAPSVSAGSPPPSGTPAAPAPSAPAPLVDERNKPANVSDNQSGVPTQPFSQTAMPDMTTTQQSTSKSEMSPEAQAKIDKAVDLQGKLGESVAQAQIAENNAKAAGHQALSAQLAQDAQDRNAELIDQQRQQEAKQTELNALSDKYANSKIDTKNYFAQQSTGEKVLSVIALSLGAMGQAFAGPNGKNQALEMINQAVDRDIDAQKTNIDNQGRVIQAKRGILDDMRGSFKDKLAAEDSVKATYLKSIANQYDAAAASAQNPVMAAQAAQNSAALKAQAAELQGKAAITEQKAGSSTIPLGGKSGYALDTATTGKLAALDQEAKDINEGLQAATALKKAGKGGFIGRKVQGAERNNEMKTDPDYDRYNMAMENAARSSYTARNYGRAPSPEALKEYMKTFGSGAQDPDVTINKLNAEAAENKRRKASLINEVRPSHPYARGLEDNSVKESTSVAPDEE